MKKWLKELKIKVRKKLKGFTTHDYWHAIRVCNLCEYIGRKEKADLDVLIAAALLHDIYADKNYKNHISKSIRDTEKILKAVKFPQNKIKDVIHCIKFHETYRWFKNKVRLSKEAKILQDADRLEALGAIGIARTFSFGGQYGRPIYNPKDKRGIYYGFRETKKSSITHFYEKLLRLKEGMNTKTGKKLAKNRHKFMELYLKRFFKEWEGKL